MKTNNDLFVAIDDYIESLPIEVLEKAEAKALREGNYEDYNYYKKIIKEKEREEVEIEDTIKIPTSKILKNVVKGLTSGFKSSNDVFDYEPFQFEEEELEEDDYFFEDDKD